MRVYFRLHNALVLSESKTHFKFAHMIGRKYVLQKKGYICSGGVGK